MKSLLYREAEKEIPIKVRVIFIVTIIYSPYHRHIHNHHLSSPQCLQNWAGRGWAGLTPPNRIVQMMIEMTGRPPPFSIFLKHIF